jgi:hypothetical protein
MRSHSEQDMEEHLSPSSAVLATSLRLQNLEKKPDIDLVTGHLLGRVVDHYPRLKSCDSWPDEENIQALIAQASGLFVSITTACTFIRQRHPEN